MKNSGKLSLQEKVSYWKSILTRVPEDSRLIESYAVELRNCLREALEELEKRKNS